MCRLGGSFEKYFYILDIYEKPLFVISIANYSLFFKAWYFCVVGSLSGADASSLYIYNRYIFIIYLVGILNSAICLNIFAFLGMRQQAGKIVLNIFNTKTSTTIRWSGQKKTRWYSLICLEINKRKIN
jgi:hypothetical protein